jgi:hypothetical protein
MPVWTKETWPRPGSGSTQDSAEKRGSAPADGPYIKARRPDDEGNLARKDNLESKKIERHW